MSHDPPQDPIPPPSPVQSLKSYTTPKTYPPPFLPQITNINWDLSGGATKEVCFSLGGLGGKCSSLSTFCAGGSCTAAAFNNWVATPALKCCPLTTLTGGTERRSIMAKPAIKTKSL